MEGTVPRRVSGRTDEANTGRDLRLTLDLANVLPGWKYRLNPARQALSGLRQAVNHRWVGPELVFHVGHNDLDIGVHRFVRVFFFFNPTKIVGGGGWGRCSRDN